MTATAGAMPIASQAESVPAGTDPPRNGIVTSQSRPLQPAPYKSWNSFIETDSLPDDETRGLHRRHGGVRIRSMAPAKNSGAGTRGVPLHRFHRNEKPTAVVRYAYAPRQCRKWPQFGPGAIPER